MTPRELAEKIAYLLLERGHLYDEDIKAVFSIDDFELIKAKNILCRYYGIAVEKWHKDQEENRQAIFLSGDFDQADATELIAKVFHDPTFKTRRQTKEEERKLEIKGEVRELFNHLKEEWGDQFQHSG
ncbi:MAG: hypothetical protein A2V52_02260 [Actinobacteria bacterium RBG_19FT_COMBO_54_7]|uniref:Uncharacterized protein n=1 Tax=Candidatus Solincola sediminis TaxID=1797199 RepID=A0A1F2WSA0_9ACTN|nr:MAG: hypothetical protein A2Y75_04965 [Candidatus Solincola sediminis]OFW61603.1 MAG: hypothetical protein A2W01_07985 [Candidatus Solincola sediminis]OFW70836.1 MAG: hypothetical protein A2V52_02260 [Actinobacteria bacterium RBG_19FT_COMBO_54_7]